MRLITEQQLAAVLGRLPDNPRVIVSGNYATPWRAIRVLDDAIRQYRLFTLNAQPGFADRDGVTLESPFIGPGMRGKAGLRYFPCACPWYRPCWPGRCRPTLS